MATKDATPTGPVDLPILEAKVVSVWVLGQTPLLLNAMSAKAQGMLLVPHRKTRAERDTTDKHHPLEEYRGAAYAIDDDEMAPTYLGFPAAGFKRSLATAALRTPGAVKTEVGQLIWVVGELTAVYGLPSLSMAVVRQADMARTPDIRTRVAVASWAAEVTIEYAANYYSHSAIVNLLTNAGRWVGVGDGRPEKQALRYGTFRPVNADDPELAVVRAVGRAQQLAAMETPTFFDRESERLYAYWQREAKRHKDQDQAADQPVTVRSRRATKATVNGKVDDAALSLA